MSHDPLLDNPLMTEGQIKALYRGIYNASGTYADFFTCPHPKDMRSENFYDGRYGCRRCNGWGPKMTWWRRLIEWARFPISIHQ